MTAQQKSENLVKAREKLGLTQAQVAEEVGVNANWYARFERGEEKPSLTTLEKIAKVLKIKSSDILSF